MKKSGPGIAFIAIGFAFIAIGFGSQRAFLGVGVAFIVIGFVRQRQHRKKDRSPSSPDDSERGNDSVAQKP